MNTLKIHEIIPILNQVPLWLTLYLFSDVQ